MKELRLQFISIDDWNRPVFKDEKGDILGIPKICSITEPAKKMYIISIRTKNYMNIYIFSG